MPDLLFQFLGWCLEIYWTLYYYAAQVSQQLGQTHSNFVKEITVALPHALETLIGLVVLFLVVNGLKALSELVGKDLSGWTTIVVGIIVATIIFFLNQVLALAPVEAQPIIAAIFNVIVLLLGSMGIKRVETKLVAALVAVRTTQIG